ncbi:MAG TPA: TauD/TfdA family dioxygenase [Burkholderiales bacterium]|nr:TauD/TfdA family dioxygenase [Burkholderiales bacterium]
MPVSAPSAVSGPSVWYGRDLQQRSDWIRNFSASELAELDAAVRSFKASGAALEKISPASFPLPVLGKTLAGILVELLEGRGFAMLRGFPVDRYTREEQAIAYLGLGSWFGRARSQNAKGHLLGHVKDLGLDITDPKVRYYQTSRKLEYHTDSVDIVGLLCLKTAKSGGESFIASSMTLYNEVLARRPDLAPALFEPYPTDRRGEVPEGMQPWFDMPIFHRHAGRLTCIYVRQYIESAQELFPQAKRLRREQVEAMDLLDSLVNDPQIHLSMAFLPGDMQFLHNHQILHSRNDFENWPEPERHRHLLRLWLAPPGARPLPEIFAPRYGSVAPGERGGIVVRGTKLKVPLEAE